MDIKNMKGRTVPADDKMEAFYQDSLTAIARIAREKYGDQPKVIHIVALLARATGMAICAAKPEEHDLAAQTALANIEYSIERYATGVPNPMTNQ